MSLSVTNLRSLKRSNFQLDVSDIQIEPRQAISIIGSNGSGKTTFMEALLGLAATEERDIALLGKDIRSFEKDVNNRKELGVQLQKSQYNKDLTVADLVRLFKVMYERASSEIFSALNIEELLAMKYQKLSRGQRQRVDLYLALAHEPKLIFLDEPNTGLDAEYKQILSDLLLKMKANNATILMASHVNSEIEMCEKVILMEGGRVRDFGPFRQVVSKAVGKYKLIASCLDEAHFDAVVDYLKALPDLRAMQTKRQDLEVVAFAQSNILDDLFGKFSAENYSHIGISECDLNDLIAGSRLNGSAL